MRQVLIRDLPSYERIRAHAILLEIGQKYLRIRNRTYSNQWKDLITLLGICTASASSPRTTLNCTTVPTWEDASQLMHTCDHVISIFSKACLVVEFMSLPGKVYGR